MNANSDHITRSKLLANIFLLLVRDVVEQEKEQIANEQQTNELSLNDGSLESTPKDNQPIQETKGDKNMIELEWNMNRDFSEFKEWITTKLQATPNEMHHLIVKHHNGNVSNCYVGASDRSIQLCTDVVKTIYSLNSRD